MCKITLGGFPFTKSFDATEQNPNTGELVVVEVLKAVQAQYSSLRHWSLPFNAADYNTALASGQAIRNCGVDVIPVGFTVPDVCPIDNRDAFVEYLKAQATLTEELECPHIMLLPEAWRKNTGLKPFVDSELDTFLLQTATSIADGLAEVPDGFNITLEMLSPHEFRNLNNLPVMIRLVCLVREILAKRRQWINVKTTIDTAHLFYPRVASRPRMDVAFGGKAIDYDVLLRQFEFAVVNGYVGALHVSLEMNRSNPLNSTTDGQTLPLDDFLAVAVENDFGGTIDVEVMLGTHGIITGSGLEGIRATPDWDVTKPEEPIVATLFQIEQVLHRLGA